MLCVKRLGGMAHYTLSSTVSTLHTRVQCLMADGWSAPLNEGTDYHHSSVRTLPLSPSYHQPPFSTSDVYMTKERLRGDGKDMPRDRRHTLLPFFCHRDPKLWFMVGDNGNGRRHKIITQWQIYLAVILTVEGPLRIPYIRVSKLCISIYIGMGSLKDSLKVFKLVLFLWYLQVAW